MKRILSILIIIALSTILALGYNASTNLALRLLEATDDVRPFREDFNYNFELVDDIFDVVSLTEFSYLDGVTSAIQTQLSAKIEATLTQEEVDDFVNALIKDSDSVHTRITITYDDTDNAFDFVVDDLDTNLTEEEVEDFVGTMLGGTETNITVTYVDGTNDIDFVVTLRTQAEIEDWAGGLFTGNTETLITATYQVADNTLDLVVDNDLHNYSWANVVDADITNTLTSSSCTGLAATATALATGRNIGGVSFDGTADITPIYLSIDHALGTNEDYSGITDSAPVGETVAIGDLLYYDWTDVEWKKAKADAITTTPAMRIALETGNNGDTVLMLVHGYIRDDDAFNFGAARIFLNDDTAGTCDDTAPAESGDQIQVVGIGITADILYFCPSIDVGEI